MIIFYTEKMSVFNRGERVRIIDPEKNSNIVYRIRDMKKIRNGGTLYLLKSLEENSILRLYYEDRESLLERIY
jgi:hypothetical protein